MDFTIFDRIFHFFSEQKQWVKFWGYIDKYVLHNIPFQLALVLMLMVFILTICSISIHGEKKKKSNLICLGMYFFALVLIFILCKDQGMRDVHEFSIDWYLIPGGYHESRVLSTMVFFILFVPLGFLIRKCSGSKHFFRSLLFILIFGVGIEILQYLLLRGNAALQDALAYVIGAVFGILLRLPFEWRKKNK